MKTPRLRSTRLIECLLLILLQSVMLGAPLHATEHRVKSAPPQIIVVDGQGTGPVFDGIGAVSAGASSRLLIDYPQPERSQILDYLFKPDYGASLQRLKVEIGSDANSGAGSEPSFMRSPTDQNFHRGYEWWLMSEARKRNPQIILDTLAWGAPGWIGEGRFYSEAMANYVADFIEGAKKVYGLNIEYTGVWNEHVYSAVYVKELHKILESAHLATKIVCCDEYPGVGGNQWEIIKAMRSDPVLASSVAVVGVHYPWIYNHVSTPEDARAIGKPLWSTEDQPNSGGGPIISRDWDVGGRLLARLYNLNYLQGGFTATEVWSPITSYYDILPFPGSGLMIANTPWSGHYKVQGAIWATAHTTQFTEPGWTYDNPSCGYLAKGGSFVTFLSPGRKRWSSVVESIVARKPQRVLIEFTGGLDPQVVRVWETNSTRTFDHIADLKPLHGALTLTVDPDSLYTITNTTGQSKGAAVPPMAAPFPMPYSWNFEFTPIGRSPKYLSDQDGAFEVHACRFRSGNCLEQMVTEIPIRWGILPDPYSIAGDQHWKDYQVSTDVQIPDTGIGMLFGRIDSADGFLNSEKLYPSGYGLLLKSNGSWRLISTAYRRAKIELASGEIQQRTNQWHQLALSFKGSMIQAFIDGQRVASVEDSSHAHGMVAVGSNWTRVQFDNLKVGSANR